MDDLKQSLGFRYLHETKFSEQKLRSLPRLKIEPVPPYKEYAVAEKTTLPRAWEISRPLQEVLQYRRSCRRFSDKPLSMEELAMLLWASQGITGRAGSYFFRTAPSAGALYPVETYLAVQNVETLAPGLYHFQPSSFSLERLRQGSAAKEVAAAALGQAFLARAGVVFLWSAVLRRNFSKYGHRGLRYVLLDAGHICQNLLLAAEGLELGACPVAAFYDDRLNSLLDLDGEEESVVYLAAVGAREKAARTAEES